VRADNTVIGLQLIVPLYQGGLIDSRTEEAIRRHEAAQQDLEGQRRAVERETRAAFQGTTGSAARIDALKHAIRAAESALTAKIEGRKLGLYTTLDLLDSTRDLYRAKRDYAESRHAYLFNLLKLKNSAGTLGEDDVMAINRWLH
jgi:outer membrane protein